MKKVVLEIEGIHCKNCEILIEEVLKDLEIQESFFNGNKLTISFDEDKLTLNQIKQAIKKEGYGVK